MDPPAPQTSPLRVGRSYRPYVAWSGRIGFACKAIIYTLIAVLTFITLTTNEDPADESPQGVFVFIGSSPDVTGDILLLVMLIGVILYVHWRFVEAFTGQGTTRQLNRWQNFFRYRLSPFVSGIIYTLYAAFIIYVLINSWSNADTTLQPGERNNDSCFPQCWYETTLGRIGLFLLAVCFFLATLAQLQHVVFAPYMTEMKQDLKKAETIILQVTGRIGFFGRAVLFFLVGVVFAIVFSGKYVVQDPRYYTISQALNYWTTTTLGEVALWTMSVCLVVYGIFALLCTWYRVFPTSVTVES